MATALPGYFYQEATPGLVSAPHFILTNLPLAEQLELGDNFFDLPETLQAMAGNGRFKDFVPVALAYAGHQFGGWNPRMGDGRAHLIGTIKTSSGDFDLQLKGSGPTPFARNGDGRASLGPMLREYIVSEAMAGLGIPTTRSLCVVKTGEEV